MCAAHTSVRSVKNSTWIRDRSSGERAKQQERGLTILRIPLPLPYLLEEGKYLSASEMLLYSTYSTYRTRQRPPQSNRRRHDRYCFSSDIYSTTTQLLARPEKERRRRSPFFLDQPRASPLGTLLSPTPSLQNIPASPAREAQT